MVDLAQSIQDLGLAGMLIFGVVVAFVGAARGWYVFGFIYREERDRRLVAETQAVRNGESLAKSGEAYVEMSEALAALSRSYADLAKSYAELRRDRARRGAVDAHPQ